MYKHILIVFTYFTVKNKSRKNLIKERIYAEHYNIYLFYNVYMYLVYIVYIYA